MGEPWTTGQVNVTPMERGPESVSSAARNWSNYLAANQYGATGIGITEMDTHTQKPTYP
jgi:hypothetical protein